MNRILLPLGVTLLAQLAIGHADRVMAQAAKPRSIFNGSMAVFFEHQELEVDGHPAFLMLPPERKMEPIPWVLYAPTLGRDLPGKAEAWMFEQFLRAGIAIAGVDVGESFGSPQGRKTYNSLHRLLVEKHGLSPQACLLARSRGGLMLYAWAADHPQKVRCITGIYPVCNLSSYPGLEKASAAYGLTKDELAVHLAELNPIERLAPLAAAKIPLLHIHGDVDEVVPLETNSGLVAQRYRQLGGSIKLVVPKGQGHNMWPGFFQCQELVDFLIQQAGATDASDSLPKPLAHWKLDDEGNEARDSAGNHHGIVHGAVSHPGLHERALLFDRSRGDHVSIPYSADFELASFTVAAWVNLTKEPTFSGIVGTRFGGEFTFDMKVNTDKVHGDVGDGDRWIETKVNFYAKDVGSNGQGGDLQINRWYHIAFVVDESHHTFRLYLDGDKKQEIPFEGRPRMMKPGQTMRIGNSSTTEFMDGLIDEVFIWGQPLSDQQIQKLAANSTQP